MVVVVVMMVVVVVAAIGSAVVAVIVVADHGPANPTSNSADRTGHYGAANRAGCGALGCFGDRPSPTYRA